MCIFYENSGFLAPFRLENAIWRRKTDFITTEILSDRKNIPIFPVGFFRVIFRVLFVRLNDWWKGVWSVLGKNGPAFNLSAFIIKLNQPSIPTLIKNIQKFHSENFMIFHAFGIFSYRFTWITTLKLGFSSGGC